jgi:DNA-binding NarL/FixJ family response regulator
MIQVESPAFAVEEEGRRYVAIPIHAEGGDDELGAAFTTDAAPSKDPFALSSREREVLALVAQGRTNREIGERLYISQKTVGVHVGNILAKLGASGRVEAAMVAVRLGLVTSQ